MNRWRLVLCFGACLLACSGGSGARDSAVDGPGLQDAARADAGGGGDLGAAVDGVADRSADVSLPQDAAVLPDLFSGDAPPACGDGVRDDGEQCDDGANENLDGCDAFCRFEQILRINSLRLQFGVNEVCSANALGGAFTLAVRDLIQQAWADDIGAGRINLMMQFFGLSDLSGSSQASPTVGWLTGTPIPGEVYDGRDDLDWWYRIDPNAVSAERLPLAAINATIAGGELQMGPGSVPLRLNVTGVADTPPALLRLADARALVTLGAPSAPTASVGAAPPGHRPEENLDADLMTFSGAGAPGLEAGNLCGKLSAASLDVAPAPAVLAGTGVCSERYPEDASLLDVLVGGCTNPLVGTLLRPVSPDTDVSTVAPAGAGPPYTLELGDAPGVGGCLDAEQKPVALDGCLRDAAYSAFFRFAALRVMATP